ncbi:MAG: DUF1109 family protein [Bdellovibrionaceae bacterium]|nr:DUF1109 family protein [Bdellovibrionales bacterium]MCB9083928.1 DUF1109 family protein [Pseudobdellovibrionaceae bacterium]
MADKISTNDLINQLSLDLTEVTPPKPIWWTVGQWLILCLFVAIVANTLMGYDPQVWQALMSPLFLLKQLVLLAASAISVYGAISISLPGQEKSWPRAWAVGLSVFWLVFLLFFLGRDIAERGTDSLFFHWGMFCVKWILITALPLGVFLILRVRAGYPLHRGWAGFLTLTAAGTFSGFALQFHCFGDPFHSLLWHLVPVYLIGGSGILVGQFLLRSK